MLRRILITGAKGQLGKALNQKLKDKYDVVPTDRKISKSEKCKDITTLDIADRNAVQSIIY